LIDFFKKFQGRSDLLEFASHNNIPVSQTVEKPWSTDENMFHISYEAGILENPNVVPSKDMWKFTKSLIDADQTPQNIVLQFKEGLPVCLQIYGPCNILFV
jgi:argininosuccinate synthase